MELETPKSDRPYKEYCFTQFNNVRIDLVHKKTILKNFYDYDKANKYNLTKINGIKWLMNVNGLRIKLIPNIY